MKINNNIMLQNINMSEKVIILIRTVNIVQTFSLILQVKSNLLKWKLLLFMRLINIYFSINTFFNLFFDRSETKIFKSHIIHFVLTQ